MSSDEEVPTTANMDSDDNQDDQINSPASQQVTTFDMQDNKNM